METDDDQGSPTEADDRTADAGGAGCAPARQPLRLQPFGRHGRYTWSVDRRGRSDRPASERHAG